MKRKNLLGIIAVTLCVGLLAGCAKNDPNTNSAVNNAGDEETVSDEDEENVLPFSFENYRVDEEAVAFSHNSGFYDDDMTIELAAKEGATVYYTKDGSVPDTNSTKYENPIEYRCPFKLDFPNNIIIRAVAVDADGTISDECVRTYFLAGNIADRVTTPIFSIWADKDDLYGEEGILTGDNYKLRGEESERPIYITGFDADGTVLFTQNAGARVYGGASRESSIKSLKLFARESYGKKKFDFSLFGTIGYDGKVIDKYKKMVLRNAGNDFQFAFIRDELNQTLVKQAGYQDFEGVVPVVGYVNGEYYGFYWLHENYCDELFKAKYGDAEGEFVVLEGSEIYKAEDEEYQTFVDEYNSAYEYLSSLDMTVESNYNELCDYIDVNNYLDYYAFNVYINNRDWPHNNYKVYRYCPAEGEDVGEGVFDGRWRYLPHDMDYSYSLYGQAEVQPEYDNIERIMREGHERYSPLFTALMQRDECKTYFNNKVHELEESVFESTNWNNTLNELHETRAKEQSYYYKHLDMLKGNGDRSIWTYPGRMDEDFGDMREFIRKRPELIKLP